MRNYSSQSFRYFVPKTRSYYFAPIFLKMSVFLVVSFDFCGDSNVALHILTVNQEEADTMYEHLYKNTTK